MDKYRIRLANGRVVGPFNKDQITELYAKGHIEGTEECQLFPAGEWLKVLDFDALSNIFRQNLNQTTTENATVLRKLSELNLGTTTEQQTEITSTQVNKPAVSKNPSTPPTPSVIDEQDPNFPKEFSYKNLINKDPSRVNISIPKKEEEKKPTTKDDGPKTLVRKSPVVDDNADKTIVNPSTKDYLEQLKKDKELANQEAKKREESRVRKMSEKALEPEDTFDPNQATQMFSLAKVKENLHKEAQHAEQELDLIKREFEIKKTRELKAMEEENVAELPKPATKASKKEDKPKKGMKPIIAIVFLGIILYFMFPDQEEKKRPAYAIDVFTAKIDFPAPFKQENAEQSKAEFERAQELYKKGDMTSVYKAALAYKSSLEHKFNGNESLGRLILTYAELLDDVKKDRDAGNEIFKLIQIAKTKGINDIYLTMGTAIFYDHFKKHHAAIKTIEDYLLVNKQKSQKLVAIYIKVLTNSGNLSKAKATIEKIINAPDKNSDMYHAISIFYLTNNEHKEALKWVDEGLSKFPNYMPLIIMKSDIIVYNEDFKGLSEQVKKIKSLEAEHSMRYYAKYLEYFGLLSAVAKKNDEALIFFKEALKIKQSPELISKLASLESSGGGDKVSELISMSKSIDYMNKAKEAVRRKNWESAFSFAIEATDIAPKYYPAKLLLASVQVKQGFFNQAIETLTKLQQEYPNEGEISFALIEAFTQSFKFKDALRLLDSLAATDFKNTPEYTSALGRFYAKKADFFQAVTWLQKSINVNPIFDEDYYILAQTYLKNRSYAKAKVILTKAMELDPSNVDYKVSYSKIIYEMDDAETAIGFLRSALNQNPNDPTLMSEIAIYYYRSGQTKYFEEYKKQLEEMPDRNRNLYQFLIRAAEMDDKPENMVKFAKELISIEPGDLETRMLLATTLSENKRFEEALEQLNFIEERLPTYPKLLYLRSKILLDMGKKDEAITVAKKEIEANPQSEEGNILLGNIYVNLAEYLLAENHFKNAQKINPKSTEALVGLAWISFQRNNIETALDLYTKVTKLDPNNSYAHKQLGLVYKLMGQGALAVESFKVYLELEPDAKDRDKIKGYIQELQ